MIPPRAELVAAELNFTTGYSVNLALVKFITKRIHLTDNQITLCWIHNPRLRLKRWSRNKIIEISRLLDQEKWLGRYITADLGTIRGARFVDIFEGSRWVEIGPS